jgi:uncharacterized protein
MPGSMFAWYTLYDLEALAEREADLSGGIELRQLTRLREILHSDRGSIEASLKFHRHSIGSVTVDLTFETVLELVCQRCMEPLVQNISEQVSLTLVEEESMDSEYAKEHEAVVLTGGKLNPAALVEDELIVSLPIIPRHVDINECGTIAQSLKAYTPEEQLADIDPTLRNR